VLCDNALVNGFAADVKPVGRQIVEEVCRDFHLTQKAAAAKSSRIDAPVVEPHDESTADARCSTRSSDRAAIFVFLRPYIDDSTDRGSRTRTGEQRSRHPGV
jgi:hypothetical protein